MIDPFQESPHSQQETKKEVPTLGPSNSRTWKLLGKSKPFYIKIRETLFYVDRGGWAKTIPWDRQPAVKAATLLNQDKKPDAPRNRAKKAHTENRRQTE